MWQDQVQLLLAVKNNNELLVRKLIAMGADVNFAVNNWTPLQRASFDGNDAMITLLISYGADVNLADKEGYTPLMLAFCA